MRAQSPSDAERAYMIGAGGLESRLARARNLSGYSVHLDATTLYT